MKTAKELMNELPLSVNDAVRLILECTEKLGEEPKSRREMMQRLRRVIDEGVAAVQAMERTESFEHVAWASVEARSARRPATRRDLRHYVRRMLRVEGVAQLPLRRMTSRHCRSLLQQAFGGSLHSYRKGRAILHSIFAFGMRREWCDANPVDRIEAPQVCESPIRPLTLPEVRRLEAAASRPEHAPMRFSLQLMLYSGLRPTEVKRLSPEDVRWEQGEVLVRPAVSKTGGGRIVPLRVHGGSKACCIIPANWEERWRRLRRAAGFDNWRADVCRHSFASYHAAHFRDLGILQCEMGHGSLHLLRTRYISPICRAEAKLYWAGSVGAHGCQTPRASETCKRRA